eukprot:TRINITY_DN308_c0_g3_i1.p1 TRINITY_DN308_c0_g3~~TRINITY_DN308_c0_g3_i1.p1  ORF type:complete len:772 (-),score=158.30 TRINITY_DN308_c0_g3_i1:2167-4272(-)
MAINFMHNISSSMQLSLISQKKFKLEICCQMYGSGKTYLGENFLNTLKSGKLDEKLKNLQHFDTLLQCDYVLLDLRFASSKFHGNDNLVLPMVILISQAVLFTYKEQPFFEDLKQFLENCAINITILELLRGISKITGKRILYHIDEIDVILNSIVTRNQEISAKSKATVYYTFWNLVLSDILLSGNLCYVSGRSSILYTLGKGYYANYELTSPTACVARTLDPLNEGNIYLILKELQMSENDSKELSKTIYRLTAGIPRFVKYCVDCIIPNYVNTSYDDLLKLSYDYILKQAEKELCPYKSLDKNFQSIYLELVRIAIFHIPVDPELNIADDEFWNLPGNHPLTLRDGLSLLPVYTANAPNHPTKIVVVISDLHLFALQNDMNFMIDSYNHRLPIGSMYLKLISSQDWRTGEPFERSVTESIILRESYSILEDCTYSQLYPFLQKTCISHLKVTRVQSRQFIPRFKEMNTVPEDSVKQFMKEKQCQVMDADVKQKSTVLKYAKSGVIYTSSKTSAADIYKFEKGAYIGWQVKIQKLTPAILKQEVEKSILHDTPNIQFVLVFVVEEISSDLLHYCMGATTITQDQKILAYQLDLDWTMKVRRKVEKEYDTTTFIKKRKLSETAIETAIEYEEVTWTVPINVEVVILKENGLRSLLGDLAYKMLMTKEKMDTFVASYLTIPEPEDFLHPKTKIDEIDDIDT